MKFHCDRCKTRYSIADERVRGKILKIRCKNCAAVITVRENMGVDDLASAEPKGKSQKQPVSEADRRAPTAAASPRSKSAAVGAGSALRGAFQEVFERPVDDTDAPSTSPSDSFRAPAPDHFEQEWYVAVDGEQAGPYTLSGAKEWISRCTRDQEIFCWNEDFDDWSPVEKVSHFRGIRAHPTGGLTPSPTPAPTPAAENPEATAGVFGVKDLRSEDTPKPLFAPTFAALQAEQKAAAERQSEEYGRIGEGRDQTEPEQGAYDGDATVVDNPEDNPEESVDGESGVSGEEFAQADGDFDLDIGEASRIVKVPMLAPPSSGQAVAADAGLPGVARIRKGALGAGTGAESSIPALAPLSDEALADARPKVLLPGKRRANLLVPLVAASAVVAVLLGVFLSLLRGGEDEGPLRRSRLAGDELAFRADGPERIRVITREVEKKAGRSNPRNTGRTGPGKSNSGTMTNNGLAPSLGDPSTRPLSPQDVIRASRASAIGNKRCYERALKKDPFLDVKKIKVTVTVAASGVVTDLKMDSYANTFLGQCLASRIRKWQVRKGSQGVKTTLTLSFEQM